MKAQVNLNFSLDEAKIIFDALSSHRFKISSKKAILSEDIDSWDPDQKEISEFMNQRFMAIESEIEKTDEIFKKLGEFITKAG